MSTTESTLTATVDGRAYDLGGAPTLPALDPSTGETLADVPVAPREVVEETVQAAHRAFDAWSDTTPAERDDLLNALADALAGARDEVAALEARNTGKPIGQAGEEVDACVAELRFFGGAARVLAGQATAEYVRGRTSMIRRDPIGVVGQITPWNYPLQMAIWKIGPALAAGNTVVLKPSELTPLTTLRLGELARDVLPPGVLNVLPGDGETTGDTIVRHPLVRMVALTGDVATGRLVAANGAATITRTHLELGGKAPVVVFDDADLEAVARKVRTGGFWNAGQDCTAATRVLVSAQRHDDLLAELVPAVSSIQTSEPFADGAEMGPVISREQQERVLGFLERAEAEGGQLATGGPAEGDRGFFVQPTVVVGVGQESEIVQREVFGPVVTVQPVASEEEALAWANGVEYGLASSVWSRDIGRCLRMARKLQFGTVWLNDHLTVADEMPHGGFKQSGYGKDLGIYSIEDYTVVKHVMARI